jgi:hypothetical protein
VSQDKHKALKGDCLLLFRKKNNKYKKKYHFLRSFPSPKKKKKIDGID